MTTTPNAQEERNLIDSYQGRSHPFYMVTYIPCFNLLSAWPLPPWDSLRQPLRFLYDVVRLQITSFAIALAAAERFPDVSQSLLNEFNLFSQYAAVAYCTADNEASSGADITCSAGNCPLVQQADAVTVYSFSGYVDSTTGRHPSLTCQQYWSGGRDRVARP
jgi:hypothetical protein